MSSQKLIQRFNFTGGVFLTLLAGLLILSGSLLAGASPANNSTHLEKLRRQAEEEGNQRVIVQLDLPQRPTGQLTATQKERQQARRRAVQRRLIDDLRGEEFKTHAQFKTVNAIAMEAGGRAIDRLSRHPLVKSLREEQTFRPLLGNSIPQIEADILHAADTTGTSQTVAVLDTGIDTSHDVFQNGNRIAGEACFTDEDCPEGTSSDTSGGAAAPRQDDEDHGSHVAGIAVGGQTTNIDTGTAPGADLLAINIFTRQFNRLITRESDIIRAIEHLLEEYEDIAAVNMSLGGGTYYSYCDGESPALAEAFANLRSEGIAPVVASGNDGNREAVSSPACLSDAIAVGATEGKSGVAGFSNLHPGIVELVAPGVNIRSAIYDDVDSDSFAFKSGTSMAAPHVAGSFALLRSIFSEKTISELKHALKKSGKIINSAGNDYYLPQLDGALTYLAAGESPEAKETFSFRISPNPYLPNDGNFNTGDPDQGIFFDRLPENFELTVYTVTGREVYKQKNPPTNHSYSWRPVDDLDGSRVESGVYLVLVEDLDSGQTGTGKLAVER